MLAKQDSSTDEEETSGIEHEHSPNQSLTVRVKANSHTFLTSKSFQNRIRIVVESSTLTVAISYSHNRWIDDNSGVDFGVDSEEQNQSESDQPQFWHTILLAGWHRFWNGFSGPERRINCRIAFAESTRIVEATPDSIQWFCWFWTIRIRFQINSWIDIESAQNCYRDCNYFTSSIYRLILWASLKHGQILQGFTNLEYLSLFLVIIVFWVHFLLICIISMFFTILSVIVVLDLQDTTWCSKLCPQWIIAW